MNINADKFTAVDLVNIIQQANALLTNYPQHSYEDWQKLLKAAHEDYDHPAEVQYLLCMMQIFEAQLIEEYVAMGFKEGVDYCGPVVNGGFN